MKINEQFDSEINIFIFCQYPQYLYFNELRTICYGTKFSLIWSTESQFLSFFLYLPDEMVNKTNTDTHVLSKLYQIKTVDMQYTRLVHVLPRLWC